MILITHNIAVISYMADQVNVMYAGKIVESGLKKDVILTPVHPYNVALISAVPGKKVKGSKIILKGDTPNLVEPPPGCSFHPRCPVAFNVCGWSADEVAADLKYLIEDKYADMFKGETVISTNGKCSLMIRNVEISKVKELVNLEKEKMRSLTAIDTLSESEGGVKVELKHYLEPELYQTANRLVSCLLYAPHDEKLSSQTTESVN
jgi:peptide/nickel transport system ATP-binding protein